MIKINIAQLKNVEVYGCHLSGVTDVELSCAELVEKVVNRIKNLKPKACCTKKTKIQIVSTSTINNINLYRNKIELG